MALVYPDATAVALLGLCQTYLRAPDTVWTDSTTGLPSFTFNPALSSAEQTTFNDLMTMVRFGISDNLTLAEWQAVKSDAATAKAYVGLASPTNAQTVAALKSTIRVLGALLRS